MSNSQKQSALPLTDAERFRLFVSSVSDYAIYMLSPEGYVSSWNVGAERFKGYKADEIIGQHFSRFYTEEDRAKGKPKFALKCAIETGKFEDEGWRVRKDGTRFWASVLIDPIRDGEGELIGFAKVTRDITERKLAQEKLRASEERFRLLVQSVTDYAIYMLSPTGEVTNWNAGAQRIKGYSAAEAIGLHFSRFYTEEDRAAGLPVRALEIATREGRFESEGWRVRKDGSRFWANAVIDSIRSDTGMLLGFAKVTRDMTERRAAAEALERAKEALFQSQKLEALGKLTGGIAHDFNNLLAVVVSGIELLAARGQSLADGKVLESMQRAATRGAKLTQQLLAFARQQPLNPERHNLNRVITAFEAVLRRACHESIKFELNLSPLVRQVLVDATQFETGLLNLVTNAIDAMPNGGTLTLSTENVHLSHRQVGTLPAGDYVRVSVKDTGIGMSPEVASRAIEPFFTTKDVGKGTGLGLSQVYGLVQQSSGDMVIETEEGNGSCMSMYLPAAAPAGDAVIAEAAESVDESEKVLVVDDQPEVLEMTVELLRSLGYEVMSASCGEDALEVIKRVAGIGVLFTDMRMPGISGIVLAREARRLMPNIKVILATGFAAASEEEESARRDFAFLTKPYRLAELAKLLRKPA